MPRFFAPDQATPGQQKKPWDLGDVFTLQHGPDPNNIYMFEVILVNWDGSLPTNEAATTLANHRRAEFATEIDAFLARVANSTGPNDGTL